MKKIILLLILLFLFSNCRSRKVQLISYVSTLENGKVFSPTQEENKIIDSLKNEAQVALKKCQNIGGDCIDDREHFKVTEANFKGGIDNFRKILFEKFKVQANAQKGENRLRVTIGKQNAIEKIDFIKYTDEASKKEIERLFQSKELDNWYSAKVYKYPVKQEFEISIFIEEKR